MDSPLRVAVRAQLNDMRVGVSISCIAVDMRVRIGYNGPIYSPECVLLLSIDRTGGNIMYICKR